MSIEQQEVLNRISELVQGNPVVIFMKGTPHFPQCGYSSRAVKALKSTGVSFFPVDILADLDIFRNLPAFADWPTFPQVYVNGELIGGCDIVVEMENNGQLLELFKSKALI